MNTKLILPLIALVILVLIGYGFFALSPGFFKKEVRVPSLQVLIGNNINSTLYNLEEDALVDTSFISDGSIVSRFRRHSIGSAVTIVRPADALGGMIILETPEGSRILDDPDNIKDTVTLSFDGAYVAYAALNLPFGETLYSENVADWNIYIMRVATGEIQNLGVGYAPQFIANNPNVLVYSTPEGIASYVINGTEEAWMYDVYSVSDVSRAIEVASDGSQLAVFNQLTDRYSVYAITQAFPLELSAIGEPSVEFETTAFTEDYFYGTVYNEEIGAYELWRYSYKEIEAPFSRGGEIVYSFAADKVPYQLVP